LGHKINKKILCKKPTHGFDNGICMGVNYIFSLKKKQCPNCYCSRRQDSSLWERNISPDLQSGLLGDL
jgi:hypothetical protein